MTGQFPPQEIWPSPPSRLAPRHHSSFLSIPPDSILSPLQQARSLPSFSAVPTLLLLLHIAAIMFHSPLSIHLHVALLIPSHLLARPSSLPFLFLLSRRRLHSCPISTFSSRFPSFFLIHFLRASGFIHPPPSKEPHTPLYPGLGPNSSCLCGFLSPDSSFHSCCPSGTLESSGT